MRTTPQRAGRRDLVDRWRSTSPKQLLLLSAVLVVVHNVLVARQLGTGVGLVVDLAVAAVVFVVVRRTGIDVAAIGARPSRRGLVAGAVAGSAVVGVLLLAILWGALPPDVEVGASSTAWFRLLVGIPIGTALCEELIFRGCLLTAWDRVMSQRGSTVVVSLFFGLWHIAAEAHRLGDELTLGGVLVGVAVTFTASTLVLCPLRRQGSDLVAPFAVHALMNMGVFASIVFLSG
jgi:membrane protease YdiL (CAAX protease family)